MRQTFSSSKNMSISISSLRASTISEKRLDFKSEREIRNEPNVAGCVCKETKGLILVKQGGLAFYASLFIAVEIRDLRWRLGKEL